MRLENLYLNFGTSSPEEQAAYISSYRLRRAEDMAKPSSMKKKPGKAVSTKVTLSDEEKAVMKLLGLKMKDVIALREAVIDTGEVEEETGNLFEDTTFEEVDE